VKDAIREEANMHETKRAALAGLIAASFACASAAAQEIKLTLADQNSPTGWGPSHALQPWVKQVEEATKGRVKIEVYPSQTLIKGVDMWKGIRGGIADIGWCVQGYWPEQTPLSDVMSLPFLPISSAEKGSEALWKLYEKFPSVKKEYSEIEPLLLYTSSPNLLVSKRPVKTLDEFKGLKWRVLGGPPTEMAKALGAVPTLIPMPDVYQSLDKGVVDGAAAPWEAVQAFRLYEVARNYTMAPFYVAYFSLCANKRGCPAS
jgi:TRAP-type C4-dicarboxylate transport system substrate-binding protein